MRLKIIIETLHPTRTKMITPNNQKNNKRKELDSLYKNCEDCTRCPLAQQGRQCIVFGKGDPNAQIMFIGEAPGRDEDIQGIPFIGRAGQLLTKIIQAMGLSRDQVFISNVVKCRPPHNRIPLPQERETCKHLMLLNEINIIQPRIICLLGATATRALLGESMKITPARGTFFTFNSIPTIPTYHPAYLLRNPRAKKIVWEDMKKIMDALQIPIP